ncbi:hypothetical protein C9I57_03470 [Trinickia symbiotica]|uniref:Uncharacterized protein n=1 Tax=Trinickia symbiotica TaxID=863227 RepID=A0A2T3XYZ1_9BURK|nr:hypothetical protein C9I57_03470 [Trinickia symbiotica]
MASAALLDVSNLDAAAIKRMPTVMNLNFLPDMGRMSANSPSEGGTTYLPALIPAANAPPRSTA